jgi:hypothetical protein
VPSVALGFASAFIVKLLFVNRKEVWEKIVTTYKSIKKGGK